MSRKITEVGLQFREKFSYTGKITRKAMGKELWNEWCKLAMKKRWTTPEHKKQLAERKEERKEERIIKTEQINKERRLNGYKYHNYCKNIELVENFYEAQKDDFNGWILHHKLEQMFTASELMEMGIYYNCKPGELMFIRVSEHNNNLKLHYGCRIRDMSKCGRKPKSVKKKNEKMKIFS